MKERIGTLDFIKMKPFSVRVTVRGMITQVTNEKTFAKDMSDKELSSNLQRKMYNSSRRMQRTQLKMGHMTQTAHRRRYLDGKPAYEMPHIRSHQGYTGEKRNNQDTSVRVSLLDTSVQVQNTDIPG